MKHKFNVYWKKVVVKEKPKQKAHSTCVFWINAIFIIFFYEKCKLYT